MLRRVAPALLMALALLAGCGDDAPLTIEQPIDGATVVKRIDKAVREAGTGRARAQDGTNEYTWDLSGPGRLRFLSHSTRVESRQIGDTVYQRAAGGTIWVRLSFDKPIQPVSELSYFKNRQATEVSVDGVVTKYVVEVPARLFEGQEDTSQDAKLAVTIFVDADGLPRRTTVEGDGLAGANFTDWGDPMTIDKPAKSVDGDKKR